MINLDDEDNISVINDILGRDSRRGLRRIVKLELAKIDKFENKILCLLDYRFFFITISKNNKPGKNDTIFHFIDIKKVESLSTNQLTIVTNDNKEFKLHSFESLSESSTDFENDSLIYNFDDLLIHFCTNLFDIFPSITIKDLIETVNIQETRLNVIYKKISETKSLRKSLNLCDSYSKAYTVCCDFNSASFYQEVGWDVNVIYGKNSINEFSLNDFDYVNQKDAYTLIWPLRHNKWFDSFHSEGVKLSNEMQEELIKVLTLPTCNIKKLALVQSNLKSDFINKLQNVLTSTKLKQSTQFLPILNTITNLKSINLSRNPIEDRGLTTFINLFKDQQTSSSHSNLIDISFSKCSISSKSVNNLFSTINLYLLNTLDLSFNNLKEEPVEFFKYLSEPNQLVELNLANTDIDVDKLFANLSKGGCDTSIKKLILNNNHTFAKFTNNENIIKFLLNTKALIHFEISNCRLSPSLIQTILSSIKHNQSLSSNGIHLNLSSNDFGSSLRHFVNEFNKNYAINSLDLSDNNFDSDSDVLITNLSNSNIKSLVLNRNFQYIKSKLATRLVQAFANWLKNEDFKSNSLEQLWLIDCKLKSSNMNELISEMGEFTKLKLLDITGNDLGDVCASTLSKALQVNRSLESLIFDRSNLTLASYQRITDSLKRNYTLKTIQMPINDICIMYQKSPDKVVDIVKQMTDTLAQRNLLNSQQLCDLNQLFKSKMKLINESKYINSTHTLNESMGSQSSNSSLPLLTNSSHSPNRVNKSNENDLDASVNDESTPSSIKEIMQVLNETACNYLNQNSIEKQFKKLNEEYVEKLDNIVNDLEKDLVNKLKKSYPKYSNFVQQQKYQLNSNQSNAQNIKNYSTSSDLAKLKSNINEYMNSMMVKMHNDICEMTYNLSFSMSEKVFNDVKQSKQIILDKKVSIDATSSTIPSSNSETPSALEFLNKKIIGAIKLPIAVSPQPDLSQNSASVQHRLDLINNSKSKRPISSQIYETPVVNTQNELNNRSLSPSKHLSSSSNENLIENSSDDDLLNDNKSREKTPDNVFYQDDKPKAIKTPSSLIRETPEIVAPVPAPRKAKIKDKFNTFLEGLGVGASNPKSPKIGRKIIDENKEPESLPVETKTPEPSEQSEIAAQPLQHINKSRPRRANVKRPTVKNPSANIEADVGSSSEVFDEKPKSLESEYEILSELTNEKVKSVSPSPTEVKPLAPLIPKPLSNQAEQPKISQNILDNVKLRKTVRAKPLNEETQNTEQPSVSLGLPNKLANRFSMFESKQENKTDVKIGKKFSEDLVEINEDLETKPSKPLPPVPPNKPPRPVFNPGKSVETTPLTNNFVKLRPVSTAPNGNSSLMNNITNSNTNNNKLNELNGIKLNNNNNSTGTTSSSSISSSSTSSVNDAKLSVKDNSDNDKRSSVKEIIQMLSDESKRKTIHWSCSPIKRVVNDPNNQLDENDEEQNF